MKKRSIASALTACSLLLAASLACAAVVEVTTPDLKGAAQATADSAKADAKSKTDKAKADAKARADKTKAGAKAKTDAATAGAKGAAADAKATAANAKAKLVDINSATEAELKAIPGIGDTYAAKIVAGRPYANKTQLKTKKVMPAPVYDKVKDLIIAKQPAKK